MNKSKKTIIYMLIALVVAVAAVFVDFGSCYAQSYSEDVQDADWHFWQMQENDVSKCKDLSELSSFDVSKIDDFDMPDFTSEHTYNFYENIDVGHVSDIGYVKAWRCQVASDSEIVAVLCKQGLKASNIAQFNSGNAGLNLISKSRIGFQYCRLIGSTGLDSYLSSFYETAQKYRDGCYYLSLCESLDSSSRIYEIFVRTYKLKVFNNADDALSYLNTGDTSGLAWQGSEPKQTYSSELAFTSFDMSVHDSNSFDDYYLEFLYKCPDEWLGKNPKLVINQTWDYNVYYFDNKGTSSPLTVNGSNTCALSVSGDRNSIKIPLGQLDCLKEFVSNNLLGSSSEMKRRVLGNTFSSPGIAYKDFVLKAGASCNVDKSFLSLSCVVYVDGVAGHEYVGSVDLITGDNSMATYTPDPSGNYTFNDDYKKGGHYYTNVGKDAAGNTTYNYYYYTTDNSKHEVTSQDSHDNTYTTTEAPASGGGGSASGDNSNNNVNNPTFNNNNTITIEGDTINNDVNNIVGNNTSSETNKNFIEKFLGFFQLLENNSFLGVWGKVFGWLPPGISSVITTALGIGACVGLFKFFRR